MGACGSRPDGGAVDNESSGHERKQDHLKVSCVAVLYCIVLYCIVGLGRRIRRLLTSMFSSFVFSIK
jgi:hypothetical protein